MNEEIFYRGGTGEEIILDPASLNLDELPLALAMAGWTVVIGYPEMEGSDVSVSLMDMGGSNGMSGTEMALSLNIIDDETGELLPGYSVDDGSGRLEVRYKGVADLRFAEFVKSVHKLSPFQF